MIDPAKPNDPYASLENYLMTVFKLLEGIADIDQAENCLHDFLETEEGHQLDENLEEFLYELFFDKCRKYFTHSAD